ncbi:MAG TPA: NHLP bacteriocin export ABC transporter permease/ATPase subunit [Chloroflexia bacterium]|nr:NHLP bacteriocin export ABC transporter permease/ATPase subunit [Chloroflexia bacterium]
MEKSTVSRSETRLPSQPYLLVVSGPQTNSIIELDFNRLADHPLVLGRLSGQADVVLQSPTGRISRRHLLVYYRPDDKMLVAADAGSSNGTRLNGSLMIAPVPLLPGDMLEVGDVQLKFLLSGAAAIEDLPQGQYREDKFPGFARLEVVETGVPGIEVGTFGRLTPGHPFTFGRHSSCDLRILETREEGYTVSRHQAEIRQGSGKYVLRDTGATNPTRINRLPLQEPHVLSEGDLIQIGSVVMRYRAPRLPLTSPAVTTPPSGTGPQVRSQPLLQPRAILRYAALWALHSGPATMVLPLNKPVKVGRGKDCELRLNDPSVSRHHAIFELDSNLNYSVTDLGSTNGTQLNGQSIKGKHPLRPGDRLTFGEFEFLYERVEGLALAADGLPKENSVLLSGPVTLTLTLDHNGNLLTEQQREQTQASMEVSKVFKSGDLGDLRWLESLALPTELAPPVRPGLTADESSKRLADLLQGPGLELSLEQIVAMTGFPVPAGGNRPFLLEERNTAWMVRAGRVEVFAVQVQEGQAINARHHVCTVPAGSVMICEDPDMDNNGLGLLAVAQAATELIKLPLTDLRYMARQSHLRDSVKTLVDDWLNRLSENIIQSTTSQDALLEAGSEIEVTANQKVISRREGVWARVNRGQFLSLGAEDLSYSAQEIYFPLYGNVWLQALVPAKIRAYRTEELIDSDELWTGLQEFYDLFFRLKYAAIRLSTEAEINRLKQSNEYDSLLKRHTQTRLASILEKEEPAEPVGTPGAPRDILMAACNLVAEVQGITLNKDIILPEKEGRTDRLRDIMRVSRIRMRQIKLETNWWMEEQGPFVAYVYPGKKPVALLPVARKKGSRYEIVDPEDGSRRPVTAEIAATLNDTGYVFYRPLPQHALRARELLRFGFRGSRKDIYVTILLGILGGLLGLFVPVMTGYVFDTVIPFSRRDAAWQVLIGLVIAGFAIITFQITRSITLLRLETRLDVGLQAALWDRLLELPATFFRKYSTGDLANRTLSIDAMRQILSASLVTTILSSTFSIFNFALLFYYDVGLALMALGITLVSVGVIVAISLWQLRHQRRLTFQQGRLASLVLQLVSGIAKLRVAGAEIRAYYVWVKEFTAQRRIAYKARTIGYYLTIFNAIWPVISFIIIFGSVSFLNARNFSTGTFLSFISAYGQFLTASIAMAVAFITALHVVPIYERAKPLFEEMPEISGDKVDPGELTGAIELNHISFRYSPESPLVLNDISLKVRPGEFVAIVGPSGSGKSSLFRLLLGFERPEAGSIYYDNQDLKGLDVQSVRRQMGVVTQNGKLMAGDIFSNIVGSAGFTHEDAWEAARLAGLDKDIEEMPMGMFTVISDNGSALSGGQRQRLMIARAIISRPRILLFDEATSALDNRTQAIVSESLEKLQATRLVIAHRLSTIINADFIYVVIGGNIVQSGTYNELIEKEGPFQELVKRQTV